VAATAALLLRSLRERATTASRTGGKESLPDLTGAIGHLGRGLRRLVDDGITAIDSDRQDTVRLASVACADVGRLWPHPAGPLCDLGGVAADLIALDSRDIGRAQRWAVAVELAETADSCAASVGRVLPNADVEELHRLGQALVHLERQALVYPPTAADVVVLDRLVPTPMSDRTDAPMSSVEAAASLGNAVAEFAARQQLTLREFRAVVAAGEISARYATVLARSGELAVTAATPTAWHLLGRLSLVFADGRGSSAAQGATVIPAAQALVQALRSDFGSISELHPSPPVDRQPLIGVVRDVVVQLPAVADRLKTSVDHWARTGSLIARAADLPPMPDMPPSRVADVISARRTRAHHDDFSVLRSALHRASELSGALAVALNSAADGRPPLQPRVVEAQRLQATAPGASSLLLAHAEAVMLSHAAFAPLATDRTPSPGPQPR
jgi:hypothetical protein